MKRLNWITRVKCLIFLSILLVPGCAILNQPPATEIPAAQLRCENYPRLVDGNMGTSSILKVEGFIEKDHTDAATHPYRYQDSIQGTNKVHALIQLNSQQYVTYIEIHPVSNIPSLTVEVAPGQGDHFTRIPDNRRAKSENASVIGVNIERDVLFLQLTVSSERDSAKSTREPSTNKITIPFKDIVIREIKFYGK